MSHKSNNFINNNNNNDQVKLDLYQSYTNNKGNWEFNFFQKRQEINQEAQIKISMQPDNCFDPRKVKDYINPPISKEEQIREKAEQIEREKNDKTIDEKDRTKPLTKTETMILDNYLNKMKTTISNDIELVRKNKFNYKPTTKEGRTLILLMTLDSFLNKDQKDNIALVYLRLMEDDFEVTPDLAREFSYQIQQMNQIVNSLDIIEIQFNKFYNQMPPLNNNGKGFRKFDDWQVDIVNKIDQNMSVLVNTPTSAGKSVLSGYAATKGRILFVVPTDPLVWQIAAYLTFILDDLVPIVTKTYKTIPNRNGLVHLLNNSKAIVGTATEILDLLPYIEKDFDWLVIDEIHMIGKQEGHSMEHIIKILKNIPILALSATIGNTDELLKWLKSISPEQPIDKIVCNKRFFNLQRWYYDNLNDKLVCLHPLAMISEEQFSDGSILKKNLQPVPPNVWDLAKKLGSMFNIKNTDLDPYIRFDRNIRIELDQAYVYFDELLKFMVEKYKTEPEKIRKIIECYQNESLTNTNVDIIKLVFKLKEQDKNPVIIFQKSTIGTLRVARELAKGLEIMETEKYPELKSERIKLAKLAKKMEKNDKSQNKDSDNKKKDKIKNSKKEAKEFKNTKLKKDPYGKSSIPQNPIAKIEVRPINEPHPDFILSKTLMFTQSDIDSWVWDLKQYFPNTGDDCHFMIKLLWRGVGVYAKGLPDPYLRLIQKLASQKKLAVVISDMSLVFGVSMPFRTAVILRDPRQEDDLDAMLYHQMAGRAGRRGLDSEGNVVFAGYSWNRIKELSICEVPIVSGTNNILYTIPHANQLSKLVGTNYDWNVVGQKFLDSNITDEEIEEFNQGIESNYLGGWNFAYKPDDPDHLYMNWKLRESEESIIISYLIPYLRSAFGERDHKIESNQIEMAHFLCRFINITTTDKIENVLIEPEILSDTPYNLILADLEEKQLDIPQMIDNQVFISIQQNCLIKDLSDDATEKLRNRLYKFAEKIIDIQHYTFHSNIVGLAKMLGKLLTRIWWIYHTSSPITKPLFVFDTEPEIDSEDEHGKFSSMRENLTSTDEQNSDVYETDSDVDYESD